MYTFCLRAMIFFMNLFNLFTFLDNFNLLYVVLV